MKKGWKIRKLEELCSVFEDGDWVESKDQSFEGVRLIQTGNIGNGFFKDRGEKARYISETTFKKLRCTEIFKGDCLVSRLPEPVGRACIIPDTGEKMITAVDCTIIRFQPGEILPEWFLFYSLSSEYQSEVNKQVSGATRQRISRKNLGIIGIPIPSLQEQRRIVSVLDEAFTAIAKAKANAEQNLKNAKELFESYLQGVFENIKSNGQLYRLANYLDLITYGFTNPMPTTSEGPYMVTAKNVKGGIVDYGTARRTSQYAFDSLITDKCRPVKGDVLLTKDGTLGRLAVVEKPNLCINQSVALLRPNKQLDSYYLKELLSSQFYQRLMIEQAGGATIKHIYITRVDKMMVPIPTLLEQQAIVKKLDILSNETKKLETIYQSKINDLEELKKSVLQKAFSGELKTAEQCA